MNVCAWCECVCVCACVCVCVCLRVRASARVRDTATTRRWPGEWAVQQQWRSAVAIYHHKHMTWGHMTTWGHISEAQPFPRSVEYGIPLIPEKHFTVTFALKTHRMPVAEAVCSGGLRYIRYIRRGCWASVRSYTSPGGLGLVSGTKCFSWAA
jgi:hypothetical protein